MGADCLNPSRAVRTAYVTCNKERNRKHLTRASRKAQVESLVRGCSVRLANPSRRRRIRLAKGTSLKEHLTRASRKAQVESLVRGCSVRLANPSRRRRMRLAKGTSLKVQCGWYRGFYLDNFRPGIHLYPGTFCVPAADV